MHDFLTIRTGVPYKFGDHNEEIILVKALCHQLVQNIRQIYLAGSVLWPKGKGIWSVGCVIQLRHTDFMNKLDHRSASGEILVHNVSDKNGERVNRPILRGDIITAVIRKYYYALSGTRPSSLEVATLHRVTLTKKHVDDGGGNLPVA